MDINNEAKESTDDAKLLINEYKFEDAQPRLHILLGPNFNYSQTYEINCTKDLQHEIIKFNVKRIQIAGSKLGVGIGISAAFLIVAVVIILAVIKWRQNSNSNKGSSMAKNHKVRERT